jgi:hypothetical protein
MTWEIRPNMFLLVVDIGAFWGDGEANPGGSATRDGAKGANGWEPAERTDHSSTSGSADGLARAL